MHHATELTSHRAAVRRDLLAAAEAVFEEFGFVAASPADVAAAANIGRTTFYEYFSDMEDLLAALVEERLPEVTRRMVEQIPRDASPSTQLSELAVGMVEFAATDHVLGLELHQGVPALRRQIQARIGAAHRSLSEEFARIYELGVTTGEFRAIPGDLAGLFLRDLVMAGAKALMSLPEPKSLMHEVADEVVGFLLNGLQPT